MYIIELQIKANTNIFFTNCNFIANFTLQSNQRNNLSDFHRFTYV